MSAGLDGGAVLRALADHPDVFPALRGEVAEFARKAMVKQLKNKGMTLDGLRRLASACGEDAVAAVLDGWDEAELAGLARKADAYGSWAKPGGEAAMARRHLLDLAAGRAEPSAKAHKRKEPKPIKEPGAPKPKIGAVLKSKVHGAAARPGRAKGAPD